MAAPRSANRGGPWIQHFTELSPIPSPDCPNRLWIDWGDIMSTVSSFMQIDVPGATDTQAQGINDAGQIVGLFSDSMGGHGFLDTAGTFTTIDVPSAIPVLGLTGYTYALG